MAAREPDTSNLISWYSEPEQTGAQPRPSLRAWLLETGLLTEKLRRGCGRDFRLHVLEPTDNIANDATNRRVILSCGEQACVYAETIIPAATGRAHPWLHRLGDEPLGERLQAEPRVTRSAFRYARLTAEQLPSDTQTAPGSELWARQSDFVINDAAITVTEVFLPGIDNLDHQRLKAADRAT